MKKRYISGLLLCAIGLCLYLIILYPPSAIASWSISGVDTPHYFTGWYPNRSMAIDSQGRVHIAYGGDHLYYAEYTGTYWQIETVDESFNVGEYTSIALDSNDHPHISYYDNTNSALKYAYHDGTSWQIETVDSSGEVGQYTSIALDSSNNPHISYYDDTNKDLKYAYYDGTSWQIITVDSPGSLGKFSSLALDVNDWPHISYYDMSNGNLKYAHFNGASWQIENVDSTDDVGKFSSLTLDSGNWPHIAYYDNTNHDLKYTYYDGSSWQIETVDSSGNIGEHTSLALDGSDRPHISYYDATNGNLKYAYYDGSSWQIETVDSTADVGEYSALALDSNGYPYIQYYDTTNKNLKYAYYDGSAWQIKTLDSSRDVGNFTSLTLDSNGWPHISYYDSTNGDLKYAYYDGSSWKIQRVDVAGDVGSYSSLTLDSNGWPHISYYDSTNGDLKYAYYDGSSWQIETVDSTGDVGKYTSLRLYEYSTIKKLHISYYDSTNGNLKYAYYDGSSWQIETVDSTGDVGKYTSLDSYETYDPIDNLYKKWLHISYYDASEKDLKYAYYDSSSWQIERIDTIGDVGSYSSLVLDNNQRPHISYYDATRGHLKYAYYDGTDWHWERVDTSGNVNNYSSLALDSSGQPHISYYDATNTDLKYAYYDGSSWQIETVDSSGDVGQDSSLTLDSSNNPHISYYDSTNKDLKYTYFVPNRPPHTPNNPSPSDGATEVSITPTLSWSGGDPDPADTVTYDIYLDTSDATTKVASDLSVTSYNPDTLSYSTTYYWKIVARDNHGAESAGSIWSFTTGAQPNNPPHTPSNPSPSDGATEVSITPTLSWSGGDPDSADTVTYDIYLDTSGATTKVASDLSVTSYSPDTLSYSTTYYWKIVARDNHGAESAGSIWSFMTQSEPNNPPEADAGSDQVVFTGETVTLDGSKSSDPDDDPLTYSWSFISRPSGSNATISNATQVSPTLTTDVDGIYVVQLIVNDGKVDSQPDICMVTAAANTGITVSTNKSNYHPGDTLELYVNVVNPDPIFPSTVDAFIGFGLADGSIYFFDSSLNLLPSNRSDTRTFTPFATEATLPASFAFPSAAEANVDTNNDGIKDSYRLFSTVLPQIPAGDYFAFAALAEPGSVQAGSPKLIGNPSIVSFTFSP